MVLESQRLQESLTQYRALASPIRCLPTEILSEIFKALPRNPKVESFGISNSPVLLSNRWRDVALSTPRLWDTVDFTVDYAQKVKPFTLEM